MAIGTIAALSLDVANSFLDYSGRQEQAGITAKSLKKQIEEYQKQRDALEESYAYESKLLSDIYDRRTGEVRSSYSLSGKEFARDDTSARTGFAYSGTVEEKRQTEYEQVKNQFTSNLNELKDSLQSAQLKNQMQREKVLSDLDITIESLRGQRKAAKAAQNEKFLGIF